MSVVAIIDDDDDLRELMAVRLQLSGYEVRVAADGVTGLELVRASLPDLVILDWMMPGCTGIEVCRSIRTTSATEALPVLMVSSRAARADDEVARAAGADEFLEKPFPLSRFNDVVSDLLSRRHT